MRKVAPKQREAESLSLVWAESVSARLVQRQCAALMRAEEQGEEKWEYETEMMGRFQSAKYAKETVEVVTRTRAAERKVEEGLPASEEEGGRVKTKEKVDDSLEGRE